MQRVNRLRFFIIAAIACAILFCIAAFSVSWAYWLGAEGSTAKIDSKSGLFYVEYPQYSDDGVVELDSDTYYIKSKQKDNSGSSTNDVYYPMSDNGLASDGRKEYNLKINLEKDEPVTLYKGSTPLSDVNNDSSSTNKGTLSGGTFTATSAGVFDFYYKEGGSGETPIGPYYPYQGSFTLTFKNNQKVTIYLNMSGTTLDDVSLWMWDNSNNYTGGTWPGYTLRSIVNGTNTIDVSLVDFNSADLLFKVSKGSQESANFKVSEKLKIGDNYKTIFLISGGALVEDTVSTIPPTVPTYNTLYVGYEEEGDVSLPEPVTSINGEQTVRNGKSSIVKNANGKYVYHNYICISRMNGVGDSDNSLAFVEFSVSNCSINPYYLIVNSLKITRKATDADGKLSGGYIDPAPRIYNYDKTAETRLGPDPSHTKPDPNGDENRYAILAHGNKHIVVGEDAELDEEDQNPHMVNHYDDGVYVVLFFGDNDQQYFALDIEIELELDKENISNADSIDALEFELTATASNLNNWQRYKDGYGMPWGFYMGGLINNVWLWDPRRTSQFEVTSGTININDSTTYNTINYNDGKGDIEYPGKDIDLSLTLNLTQGSTVKIYMIDNEGHRLKGNTIYLLPHKIEYDAATYEIFVNNPEYDIYDEELNLIIPKTGSYVFRLVGHVRQGDETYNGMHGSWFRFHDGECLDAPAGGDGAGLPNYNLIVDRLYVTCVGEGNSTCEITLDANGGKFGDGDNATTTTKKSVMFGSNVNVNKLPKPTCTGKSFVGWYTDAACTTAFANNTPATSDITLYAKWEGERFTVTFDGNGGKWGTATTKEVKTGTDGKIATADLPANPTQSGYSFKGWWTAASGGEEVTVNANTVFSGTQTLYAHWVQQHTVTFNAGDGSWSGGVKTKPQQVDDGDKVDEPSAAERPNAQNDKYVFDYWYKEGTDTAFSFGTSITGDITLYAKWKQVRFDIKFMMNDGSDLDHDILTTDNTGHLTALPTNPTRDGFDFVDWYTTDVEADQTDSTKVTIGASGTKFTADSSVYAKWEVATATKYTVTFNNNYGSAGVYKTEKVEEGNAVAEPTNPTRSGYTFRGWYEDAACSMLKDYDFAKAVNSNITLYAKWTTSTMSNTYYLVGQINSWTAQPEYYIGSSGDVVITIATANNNNERFKIAQRNGSNSNFTNWKGAGDITVGGEYNGGSDDIVLNKAGKYTIHFDGSNIQIYYYENGSYGGGSGGDEFDREKLIAIKFSDGTIYLEVSGLRSVPNRLYMWGGGNITSGFPGDAVEVGKTHEYTTRTMGTVDGIILVNNSNGNDNLTKDINPGSGESFDALEAGAVYEVKEGYFKKIGTIDDEGGGEEPVEENVTIKFNLESWATAKSAKVSYVTDNSIVNSDYNNALAMEWSNDRNGTLVISKPTKIRVFFKEGDVVWISNEITVSFEAGKTYTYTYTGYISGNGPKYFNYSQTVS
ncbi:MAG: InlB B-repeat-containing protein [Clostridiales bacterium]|nr:InlB B-repeat-containing protein [Clostridiales bacterium]